MIKKVFPYLIILFSIIILSSCYNTTYDNSGASVYEVSTSVSEVVSKVEKSCVGITAQYDQSSFLGSGVIFKKEENTYYFLTNYHVVSDVIEHENAKYKVYVESNVNPITAYILYDKSGKAVKNSAKDLVVMYFTSEKEYQTITLSQNAHVTKGESIIAIGCPISLDNYNLVSTGVVSLEEYSMSNNGGSVNVIQHTSPINPGNSGGGLFNLNAELVGINFKGTTAVKEGSSYVAVSGIYYAIAMSSIKEFLTSYGI